MPRRGNRPNALRWCQVHGAWETVPITEAGSADESDEARFVCRLGWAAINRHLKESAEEEREEALSKQATLFD